VRSDEDEWRSHHGLLGNFHAPPSGVTPQICGAVAYRGIGMSGQIDRWAMGTSTEPSSLAR
jgi:hypothetical protein